MYAEDTFFHLSLTGRIGLVVLSGVLGLGTLWITWRLARNARTLIRVLVGLGAFAVFDWLAPQAQYLWYRQVIDGLPLQWVIGPWPDPVAAARVMAFQAGETLSAHARAVLGWLCIAVALLAPRTRTPIAFH